MPRFHELPDVALRLAILDAIDLPFRGIPEPIRDSHINPTTLRNLLLVDITDADLARITRMRWEGGGHPIQDYVWPNWHGENDLFFVHSLVGIDALVNLKTLYLATDADLDPLLGLGALTHVHLLLAGNQRERSAAVLTELRRRGLSVMTANRDHTPRAPRKLTAPPPARRSPPRRTR